MRKDLLSMVVSVLMLIGIVSCGGDSGSGSAAAGDDGMVDFKAPDVVDLGDNKNYIFTDANASVILPNEIGATDMQYRIIPPAQFDPEPSFVQSITSSFDSILFSGAASKSDTTIKSNILEVKFGNAIAGEKEFIVTIEMSYANPVYGENFSERYLIMMHNGVEWIPLTNIYYTSDKVFAGDVKFNKDSKTLVLAVVSEKNFVKNNGTIEPRDLLGFWDTKLNKRGTYDSNFDYFGNMTYALYDERQACMYWQEESPTFHNMTNHFYYSGDTVSYYMYGEKREISFSNFMPSVDQFTDEDLNDHTFPYPRRSISIDDGNGAIQYFEQVKKTAKVHLNSENSGEIDGYVYMIRDNGVVAKKYIGTDRDFQFTVPAICWEYSIDISGHYPHHGMVPWVNDIDYIAEAFVKPLENESLYFEESSKLSTIFSIHDSNSDASDGFAGPGYYNYPVRPVMKQHSFDIEKMLIKEGDSTYQFEIYPTKPIFQSWLIGFDIYMKFIDDDPAALEKRTVMGRNVDFADGDGWSKGILITGCEKKGDREIYINKCNEAIADKMMTGYIREYIGNALVFTVPKASIPDLKNRLTGIQVFSWGAETAQYSAWRGTLNRVINPSASDEWHFSCNQQRFDALHPDDATQPWPHWNEIQPGRWKKIPLATWPNYRGLEWFAIYPYVLDIMNGTADDGVTIVDNTMLDTFTSINAPYEIFDSEGNLIQTGWDPTKVQFAKIRMVKVR